MNLIANHCDPLCYLHACVHDQTNEIRRSLCHGSQFHKLSLAPGALEELGAAGFRGGGPWVVCKIAS